MMNSYWADSYVEKKCDANTAVLYIRPGQRVFIGSSSGEPQHLVKAFAEIAGRYTDIEIVRLMALESTPLTLIAEKTGSQNLTIRTFYLGSCLGTCLSAPGLLVDVWLPQAVAGDRSPFFSRRSRHSAPAGQPGA